LAKKNNIFLCIGLADKNGEIITTCKDRDIKIISLKIDCTIKERKPQRAQRRHKVHEDNLFNFFFATLRLCEKKIFKLSELSG
jgi:hypothetical protein